MSEIGRRRYRQVVLQAGVPTGNGTIYPREVLQKAVDAYAAKPKKFGPLDKDSKVRVQDITFEVMAARMEDDKVVIEIDIFDRGAGVAALLREKLGRLSPIGYGSVSEDGVVKDDYILTGFNVSPAEDCTSGEAGEFEEDGDG